MQVIGRAIERIDNPDGVGLALCAAFLGEYGMIRIMLEDAIDDGFFSRVIGIADEVVVPFLLDFQLVEVDHFSDQRTRTSW